MGTGLGTDCQREGHMRAGDGLGFRGSPGMGRPGRDLCSVSAELCDLALSC